MSALNTDLLSTYYLLDTVPSARSVAAKKTDKSSCPQGICTLVGTWTVLLTNYNVY